MNDHSVFSIMAISTPEASTSTINNDIKKLSAAQAEFYANDSGTYTAPSGITNGFQQLSNETLQAIGAQAVIDAGLTNRSHIEFLYESIFYPGGPTPFYTPLGNESYISLTASSLVALSRGNLTIRSGSMADAPIINPSVGLLKVHPSKSPLFFYLLIHPSSYIHDAQFLVHSLTFPLNIVLLESRRSSSGNQRLSRPPQDSCAS
jgi:hypothetical protein